MFYRYAALALSLFSPLLVAQDAQHVVIDRIVSVYDGDTFRVDVDAWPELIGKSIPVRVRNVDTPEIRGKCAAEKALAIRARDFTRQLLNNASKVELQHIERGKYFRIVADVSIDGKSLATQLIQQNLAREYDGKARKGWC